MNKHQGAEFMGDREEPVQALVGQFDVADPGADLDTEKARLAHAPAQFVNGEVGVLKGDGAQRGEASGVLLYDARKEIILGRRQFGRAGGVRLIAERHRNRRKHLHPNAVTVHVGDAGLRGPAPAVDLAIGNPTEHQPCFGVIDALDAGPLVMRIDLAQIR